MMYTYIVERTQIYLTRRESTVLARLSKQTGRTRSQLIREAIATQYLAGPDATELEEALAQTQGLWADRTETGEQYVERIRSGRLARLYEPRPDE
ncbi:MAG TPA: CopG family transcriptional regulator [Candidatus Limnocylindrales bacterium]|nr:CopG family transcriptional regulator [Candidatus Limnocylindrales bacterium]